MGTPRSRQRLLPAERREQLMDAAARTFARLGFDEAHMDDVAKEANVAKGLLYRHFVSKEALFRSLMEEGGAEFARKLTQSWQAVKDTGSGDPWELVDAGLQAWLVEASRADTMLNWTQPAYWDRVAASRDQSLKAIVGELQLLAPALPEETLWIAAAAFQGALEAATLEWRRRGGLSSDELHALLRAYSLRGLDGLRAYLDLPVPEAPPIAPGTTARRPRASSGAKGRKARH